MRHSLSRPLHRLASEQVLTTAIAVMSEEFLVRPSAHRRVGRALRAAQARTQVVDTGHLARLALLGEAANVPVDDVEGVRAAWAALPAPPPRRAPRVMLALLALSCALGALAFVVHRSRLPFDPSSAGVGYALHTNLTMYEADWVAGLHTARGYAFTRVFPGERAQLGGPTAQAFESLFRAYEAVDDTPEAMQRLHAETRATNKSLADHALPYYLDARLFAPRQPILYAYYREREDQAATAGYEPERVVYLWRLDALNLRKSVLGYTHRESDAAIVLYDEVESFLIREVLPALAPDEIVELVDKDTRLQNTPWTSDVEARSARMVRESFHAAGDRKPVLRLGQLLAQRRAIVTKWSTELSAQAMLLRPPTRLIPEADYAKDLWLRVPRASRDAWEDVHGELSSKELTQTFEELRNRFAEDVARHEVQHRLDGQRTKACVFEQPCSAVLLPAAIARIGGVKEGSPLLVGSFSGRIWDETSAYLAEISDGTLPKMTILSLLPTLLDGGAYDSVYTNASVVVLTSLGDALSLSDPAFPLVKHGTVQRASVSSLAALLFAKPDKELAEAAGRAWKDLYGAPLAHPKLTPVASYTSWRH